MGTNTINRASVGAYLRFRGVVYLLAALALAGCVGLNNAIGAGALTISGAAKIIRLECGNTVPDGPCLPGRAITTDEKQGLKEDLQKAQVALQEAAALNQLGKSNQAAGKLSQSRAILDAVEKLLIERGIR